MVGWPVRLTKEQHQRVLKANDAAQRVRDYIDTWDMADSPEELLIEAEQEEQEAQAGLARARRLREKYALVTRKGEDDRSKVARRQYVEREVWKKRRFVQVDWLIENHEMTNGEAEAFIDRMDAERRGEDE